MGYGFETMYWVVIVGEGFHEYESVIRWTGDLE